MSVLQVNDLHASYSSSSSEILKGISFDVAENDFVAIIGPSGAGKSTLIRCINRLVEPSSGSIIFKGQNITNMSKSELRRVRRDIGMIFQEFNLINRMSVMDNLLSGRLGYIGNIRTLFKAYPRKDIDR
jgi:phosphonate transport system ATP-binding protein